LRRILRAEDRQVRSIRSIVVCFAGQLPPNGKQFNVAARIGQVVDAIAQTSPTWTPRVDSGGHTGRNHQHPGDSPEWRDVCSKEAPSSVDPLLRAV